MRFDGFVALDTFIRIEHHAGLVASVCGLCSRPILALLRASWDQPSTAYGADLGFGMILYEFMYMANYALISCNLISNSKAMRRLVSSNNEVNLKY